MAHVTLLLQTDNFYKIFPNKDNVAMVGLFALHLSDIISKKLIFMNVGQKKKACKIMTSTHNRERILKLYLLH